MNEINTATVETLTAEVRVLMVGSRQVTMSVFNQLDWVPLDAIVENYWVTAADGKPGWVADPFGRVCPRNETNFIHFVGAHVLSGALVRSSIFSPWVLRSADKSHQHHGGTQKPAFVADMAGPGITEREVSRCTGYGCDLVSQRHNPTWGIYDGWDDAFKLWKAFQEIPLIVLAGLR